MMHERLHRLSEVFPPGWYVDRQQLHHRYYVSPPNFRTMKYTYFKYNTSRILTTAENKLTTLCDFSSVTEVLTELASQLRRIESPDSLLYFEYDETVAVKNCFWISRPKNMLTWSTDPVPYPLIDNSCVVLSHSKGINFNFYDHGRAYVLLQGLKEDFPQFSHGPPYRKIYPEIFKVAGEPPSDAILSPWIVTPQNMINFHLTPNEYAIGPRDYVTVKQTSFDGFPKDFLKTWWDPTPDLH